MNLTLKHYDERRSTSRLADSNVRQLDRDLDNTKWVNNRPIYMHLELKPICHTQQPFVRFQNFDENKQEVKLSPG